MARDENYVGKTAYSGGIAANYDRDRVVEPVWQQEQDWVTEWAKGVPAGARVLDVPAGTGRFIGILKARGTRIHAVDISEDMLAQLRLRWLPEDGQLVVEHADAESLPYDQAQFDFLICWRLFHLLPPAAGERVLREFVRVCSGEIVLEVFGVEDCGWFRFRARMIKVWLFRRIRPNPTLKSPWSHITSYPQRESALLALFERCRLKVVNCETVSEYHGRPAKVYRLRQHEEPQ